MDTCKNNIIRWYAFPVLAAVPTFRHHVGNVLELGNRDSGDQLYWTTAFCSEEAEGEYIVGSSETSYPSF